MKLPVNIMVMALVFKTVLLSSQTCDSLHTIDCVAKDRSPSGILLGHEHPKGVWKFSYRYMNIMMDGNVNGTKKVDEKFVLEHYSMSPQSMVMNMHMAMAMYGVTDRLSFMTMLNYNTTSMTMKDTIHDPSMNMSGTSQNKYSSQTSGLGDVKLYITYSLLDQEVHHIWLSGGFNLPTGNIRMNGTVNDPMYSSQRLPYAMQMGSGSFDLLPGIAYLMKQNKVSFSSQITSVIRPFNNSLHYRLGNEFTLNVWGAYQCFLWMSTSVRLETCSVGDIKGNDPLLMPGMEPSSNSFNYGGQNLKSFAGLNFFLNKGWLKNNKLSVEYGLPVYQNTNGIQLQQMSTIYACWAVSF